MQLPLLSSSCAQPTQNSQSHAKSWLCMNHFPFAQSSHTRPHKCSSIFAQLSKCFIYIFLLEAKVFVFYIKKPCMLYALFMRFFNIHKPTERGERGAELQMHKQLQIQIHLHTLVRFVFFINNALGRSLGLWLCLHIDTGETNQATKPSSFLFYLLTNKAKKKTTVATAAATTTTMYNN